MKTAVGIDLASEYITALELCARLNFPNQAYVLVHAMEPIPEYAPIQASMGMTAGAWIDALRKAGEEALEGAKIKTGGAPTKAVLRDGPAASVLLEESEKEKVDLIAIGGVRKDPISTILFGSVARGVAIGSKMSVLVSKGAASPSGPVNAVVATDHSPYAQKCMETLVRFAPAGLCVKAIVTAFVRDEHLERGVVESQLEQMSRELATKLGEPSCDAQVVVTEGKPNTVISKAMADTRADLLVIGAQGHGFFERLLIGSVSLHQVTAEPYPVLVLRA